MAVRLSLKNVGAVRFAPLVLFDVLYPILLCSMRFNGTEPEMIEVYLLQMSQVIFPFFSAWDVIFVLREYNESEGNEVLFVNKRVSAGTICAVIFCAMLLNISIMMAASCLLIPDFVFEFMRIIPACVFFFGMCGFIISISKSAAISILGGVLYLIDKHSRRRAVSDSKLYILHQQRSAYVLYVVRACLVRTGASKLPASARFGYCACRGGKYHKQEENGL